MIRSVLSLGFSITLAITTLAANRSLSAPGLPAQNGNPTAQTPDQALAHEALKRGVEAFKNGQYEEATLEFRRAKNLDPNS